jgi:hypothetical protein
MTDRKELENWIQDYLNEIVKLDFDLFAIEAAARQLGLTQDDFDSVIQKITLTTEGSLTEQFGKFLMTPLGTIRDSLPETKDRN